MRSGERGEARRQELVLSVRDAVSGGHACGHDLVLLDMRELHVELAQPGALRTELRGFVLRVLHHVPGRLALDVDHLQFHLRLLHVVVAKPCPL